MEHKFLVFALNIKDIHWVSVVVVNPFLVFDQYLAEGIHNITERKNKAQDELCGWCLLNSTARVNEKEKNGFQGTLHTKNNAAYGVRLFLNVCASYLKHKKQSRGDESQQHNYDYEEPFGGFTQDVGTEEFPRFDYDGPAILRQSTQYDCGLAVVANSMAFVNHLKGKQFLKSNMQKHKQKEVRFVLKEETYSLQPFWNRVIRDASNTQHGKFSSSNELFKLLRKEFIEIVDEIAGECVTDQKFYDHVVVALGNKGNVPPAAARVDRDVTTSDTESDVESVIVPEGDAELSDVEKKMAATNTTTADVKTTTPEEERKKAESDAAKAMASLAKLTSKKRPAKDAIMHRKRGRKKHGQQEDNENKCHAGIHCRLGDIDVVVEGNASNGCLCSKCEQKYHFFCLYRFQDNRYCTRCYKEHVVSKCDTGILFQDLFQFQRKETSRAQSIRTPTESDLIKHVDNYLKAVGMTMTVKQYNRWCDREKLRALKIADKKEKRQLASRFLFTKEKYNKVIKLAKEEWLLSNDGVVTALRYNKEENQFVAKVQFQQETDVKSEKIRVSDDWVIDTFGKEVTQKLMDRGNH